MSPAERALLTRIRNRSAALEPEAGRRLLAAYDLIRQSLTEAELLRALNSGALDRLISDVLSERNMDAALSDLRRMIDTKTLDAGESWSRILPASLGNVFDRLNPRVIEAVRTLDRTVTTRIAEEVRETVRAAAEEGLRAGENPRVVARRIVGSVGLSPNQAQAVENFRRQMVAGDRDALLRVLGKGQIRTPEGKLIVRPSHAGGQGLGKRDMALLDRVLGKGTLSPAQVERMTEQYRKRLVALNAEANARSIALDANRLAQRLSWEDAVSRGTVPRNRLRRTWLAVGGPSGDGRNRPEHLELHGETVGFDDRYSNGQMVPGETDYNCRCGERITLAPALRIAA